MREEEDPVVSNVFVEVDGTLPKERGKKCSQLAIEAKKKKGGGGRKREI